MFVTVLWLNSSIWPIDGVLTGTTTSYQSGPGSNGIEELFHIPQNFTTGLVSCPGHSLVVRYYLSAKVTLALTPEGWYAIKQKKKKKKINQR